MRRLAHAFAAAALLAGALAAHDFWIVVDPWHGASGALAQFDLRVGHPGEYDAVARDPRRIERFFARRSGARIEDDVELLGVEGRSPAGLARMEAAGTWRAAYWSKPRHIELGAAKFEAYLVEEGLERIIAERAERGETMATGRELYARCAVALYAVGEEHEVAEFAPLGLPLELVPVGDPRYFKAERGDFTVALLRRGKPLAGVLVVGHSLDDPERPAARARTDEAGRCTLAAGPGAILVTAVDMERAPREVRERSEEPAEWQSHWASLTFVRSPAASRTAGASADSAD